MKQRLGRIHDRTRRLSFHKEIIVFTGSSTISNLFETLGIEFGKRLLHHSTVAVLGPVTASTAESYGKIPQILPHQSTVAARMEALGRYYKSRNVQRS
jgi:uroporphyrinogen-III synthase